MSAVTLFTSTLPDIVEPYAQTGALSATPSQKPSGRMTWARSQSVADRSERVSLVATWRFF